MLYTLIFNDLNSILFLFIYLHICKHLYPHVFWFSTMNHFQYTKTTKQYWNEITHQTRQQQQHNHHVKGQLAVGSWRTRFGRLSNKVGEVDPTGTFCAVPDEWLKKKLGKKHKELQLRFMWKEKCMKRNRNKFVFQVENLTCFFFAFLSLFFHSRGGGTTNCSTVV